MRFSPSLLVLLLALAPLSAAPKSILFIAGAKSHDAGEHEPPAACELLARQPADKGPQTIAWAVDSPNIYRGSGFTGGHFHRNGSNQNSRQRVLNGIVWSAGSEEPGKSEPGKSEPGKSEPGKSEAGKSEAGKGAASPAYQTIDEAIAHGDMADVRLHLAATPSSLQQGRDATRPPLAQAVLRNKTEIALLLLESGAKPDARDGSQRSILHLAVERNNPLLVTALLKSGAKPDVRDKDGWTPLHHAAAKNQLDTAKALLAGGANPMVLSELGGTPLHEAAASGGAEMIQLLLAHKVDPTVKSKQGVTALDIAKKYKNQAAIAALSKP